MKKAPNYILKAKLLDTDLMQLLNNLRYHYNLDKGITDTFITDSWAYIYSIYSKSEVEEGYRLINNNYKRTSRLRERIQRITSKPSIFLTLTFTDEVLSKTSSKTRREYVSRFLKSVSADYVGNIDYGEKNGREHYHAVIQADKVDHNSWNYGAINFKKITYTENSSTTIAKYVNKLTNHAIKETTKRAAIIYPKKRP